MKRPPMILADGRREISVPYAVVVSLILILAAACIIAVTNTLVPRLFGTAPLLPIAEPLEVIANVLAYFTAIGGMMVFLMFLLGLQENHLAEKRFTDFQRLVPLPVLASAQIAIAPNVEESDREVILKTLLGLAEHRGISSIFAPATKFDIEDGSVDRLFITTTENSSTFRRMVRALKYDDISKVPDRCVKKLAKKTEFGEGKVWLLTWD